MTKLELTAISEVYQYFLQEEFNRDWGELDNCLYSLAQLDDEQLVKEVKMQLEKHAKKKPACFQDNKHKAGKCMTVATMAAARAIIRDLEAESVFTDGERYVLEHYLALAHLEKTK